MHMTDWYASSVIPAQAGIQGGLQATNKMSFPASRWNDSAKGFFGVIREISCTLSKEKNKNCWNLMV